MKINTNISSLTAQEAATNTNRSISSSLEKLSTGLRINKASDDASGLAIADKLRTQVTSINQGIANGNSAIALLQIADKSMAEQSKILDTVKAKLIQANTDTTSSIGRVAIAKDVNKLLDQLNNIAEQTNYNGTALLQKKMGSEASATVSSDGLTFQIGESNTDIISTKSIQANISGYSLNSLKTDVSAGANATISSDGKTVTANGFTRTMASAHMDRIDACYHSIKWLQRGYRFYSKSS
ncbi:flagellin [Arcobacter cryaerophilus gv. pseudocryaerophilus]